MAGYGIVLDHDGLLIERLSEEHATVRATGGDTALDPGDLVRILPNHSCVVSNLVDQAWLIEGSDVCACRSRRADASVTKPLAAGYRRARSVRPAAA